jgi:hypothetical protein
MQGIQTTLQLGIGRNVYTSVCFCFHIILSRIPRMCVVV